MYFSNTKQVIAYAKAVGNPYFDKETLEYFNSKVYPTVFDNRYFITSEQDDNVWDGKRMFTIRELGDLDFSIKTVGEFGAYSSYEDAREAIYELIALGTVLPKSKY